jgi:polygalacturonase
MAGIVVSACCTSQYHGLVKNTKMFQYVVRFFFRNANVSQRDQGVRMIRNPLQHRDILGLLIKPVAKRFS